MKSGRTAMKQHRGSFVVAAFVLLALGGLIAPDVRAELYIGGQVGYSKPNNFSKVEFTGNASGMTSTNLDLQNSVLYGAKVGYFFPAPVSWLGLETEAFQTRPNTRLQKASFTGRGCTPALCTGDLEGVDLRVITWAANLMLRYPGTTFQPYIGGGPAMFFAKATQGGNTSQDTHVGLNALAGLRVFLTKNFALFAEYKYTRVKFEFSNAVDLSSLGLGTAGVNGTYVSNAVVGGITFHFQ